MPKLLSMTTPAVLRARAVQLRDAATTMRRQAETLADRVPEVQRRYPLPDENLWSGPNASTFRTALVTAAGDVGRSVQAVRDYADECVRQARELDRQANAADQTG